MGRPGRRESTPSEYRLHVIRKTRAAREKSGLSQEEMAAELSRRAGRDVRADTYRKYEKLDVKKGALLPHDLILPFCDITMIHPFELLARPESTYAQQPVRPAEKKAAPKFRRAANG